MKCLLLALGLVCRQGTRLGLRACEAFLIQHTPLRPPLDSLAVPQQRIEVLQLLCIVHACHLPARPALPPLLTQDEASVHAGAGRAQQRLHAALFSRSTPPQVRQHLLLQLPPQLLPCPRG
jgi:hypothetical protein